jgi:hypothetical protein
VILNSEGCCNGTLDYSNVVLEEYMNGVKAFDGSSTSTVSCGRETVPFNLYVPKQVKTSLPVMKWGPYCGGKFRWENSCCISEVSYIVC